MFRRARSIISRFPQVERLASSCSKRRLSFLGRNRIEQLPSARIFDQCATPDLESGRQAQLGGEQVEMEFIDLDYEDQAQQDLNNAERGQQGNAQIECVERQPRNAEEGDVVAEIHEQPSGGGNAGEEIEQENGVGQVEHQTGELPYPTYLQTHFGMMSKLGLMPIQENGSEGSRIQLMLFILVASLSLTYSGGKFKRHFLEKAKKGNLNAYIEAWYFVSEICLKLYFINLVAMHRNRIVRILQCSSRTMPGVSYNMPTQKVAVPVVVSAFCLIIAALVWACRVDWLIADGDPFDTVLRSRAGHATEFLFIWKRDTNETNYNVWLREEYEGDITVKTVAMGIFGIIIYFYGRLQHNLIRDLLFMSSLHIKRLSEIMKSSMLKLTRENKSNEEVVQDLKRQHMTLYEEANKVEDALGNLFKLIHMNNWLFCSYFFLDLLYADVKTVVFFEALIVIPKIVGTYFLSAQAIVTTEETKYLLDRKYCDKDPHGVEYKRFSPLFKRLKHYPISIGSRQFLLDEAFAGKFIGVVISCFIMFADSDDERK